MPTARPRLSVTLTPELDSALTSFCELVGKSRSSFILEILETTLPQLQRLAVLAQQLKQASPEMLAAAKGKADGLERLLGGLAAASGASLELFDVGSEPAAGPVGGSVAAPRPAPVKPKTKVAEPPPSNRGVGTPPLGANVTVLRRKPRD